MTSQLLRDVEAPGVVVTDGAWRALAEAQGGLARAPADAEAILESLARLTLELSGATSVVTLLDDGQLASCAQAHPGGPDEPIDGPAGIESLAALGAHEGTVVPWHLGEALVLRVTAHGADSAPTAGTPWGRWGVTLVVGCSTSPLGPDVAEQCRGLAAVADARLEAAWALAAVGAQERDARSRLELARHRRQLEEAQRLARVGSWEWAPSAAHAGSIFDGGGVVTWSSMLYELLQLTPAEGAPSNATFQAALHPDDVTLPLDAVRRSMQHGVTGFEYRVPLRDGTTRWLQGTAESEVDESGAAVRVWGTALDITERRRAEGELRAAEKQFRLAMDYAPVGVLLVGLDGRAIRVNRPLAALLGLRPADVVDAAVGSYVHPEDFDCAAGAAIDLIAGGRESAECDVRLLRADGSYVWTRASASMLLDADGAPQHVIVHVQDITERRALQEDLERQANTDPLTGLMNRRGWESALLSVLDIAIIEGRPLAIGLLDLDHFKVYNDTFGHPAGDRLLSEAARVWTSRLAEISGRDGHGAALARIGGEEFGVALPGCTADEARDMIADLCRLTPRGQSTSGGVTVWNPGEEISDTLARADGALYSAKRKGRRRVIAVLPA